MAILDRTSQAMNPTHLPDFRPLGAPSTYGMILSLCWLALCSQVCDGQVTDFNVERAYELSTFELPENLKLEVSGMALLPDGSVAIAIRKGEIWIADQTSHPSATQYRLFADGLHEPLGLSYHEGSLYTVQRTELTRITDQDGDGQADAYWSVARGWGVTGNYHEYAYGPQFDQQGNAWITLNASIGKGSKPQDNAWRGWSLRVAPDGQWEPVSYGFRSPSGLGMNPQGDIFTTDQQGNWFPTCPLIHIQSGAFHGHADALVHGKGTPYEPRVSQPLPTGLTVAEAAKRIPAYQLPAVWFPYRSMGMSSTDILWGDETGRFGPFDGQAFVGEFTMSMVLRVYLEQIEGQYQGACFGFAEGLQCGVLRLAWDEAGDMLIGQTNRGWNSLGSRSFGMQKLHWTGRIPFEILRINALSDGFALTLTEALDVAFELNPDSLSIRSHTYHYHASYGSEPVESLDLEVLAWTLSEDRRTLICKVTPIREGYVHTFDMKGWISESGQTLLHPSAAYTLNRIPKSH